MAALYRVNKLRLHAAFTGLARSSNAGIQAVADTPMLVSRYLENPYAAWKLFPHKSGSTVECLSFQEALQKLTWSNPPFPLWLDYINTKLDRVFYTVSGESSKATRIVNLPPTYFMWLQEQMRRRGRLERGITIHVLGEAFPQQLQGKSTAEAVQESGASGRRRWELRTRLPR